MMKNLRS